MNTLLKSAGGITQVSADSRLLSNRLIFLEGKIVNITVQMYLCSEGTDTGSLAL